MSIVVTGCSGFIGSALCNYLELNGFSFFKHRSWHLLDSDDETGFLVDNEFTPLESIDTVIHTAAAIKTKSQDPSANLFEVNVLRTKKLAQKCISNNIKHFIFISSIGVHGSHSLESPFCEKDIPKPHNIYTQTKLEAERSLREIFNNSQTHLTIIRPPLVYGKHAKGTFRLLVNIVGSGIPIPISSSNPKRSLLSVDNLVDLVSHCLDNHDVYGKILIATDNECLTFLELCSQISSCQGKRLRYFKVPDYFFKVITSFLPNIGDKLSSLYLPLECNVSYVKSQTGWLPPYSVYISLRKSLQPPLKGDINSFY